MKNCAGYNELQKKYRMAQQENMTLNINKCELMKEINSNFTYKKITDYKLTTTIHQQGLPYCSRKIPN